MNGDPTALALHNDPTTERLTGYTTYGNMRLDVPYVTQIKDNLWQGGCAHGLVLPTFFTSVLSLYPWERYELAPGHELAAFREVRMYDSPDEELGQVEELAQWVNERCAEGPTLVHCQAGLNRSGVVAGRALVLQGFSGREAIDLLRARRSPAVLCNPAFEAYLLRFTDVSAAA